MTQMFLFLLFFYKKAHTLGKLNLLTQFANFDTEVSYNMQFFCLSIFVILGTVYKLENGKSGVRNDRCAYFFLAKLPLVPNVLLREVARSFEFGLFVCV